MTAHDHDHAHDHGDTTDHIQDPALAGNIDTTLHETAETAYSETFAGLPVYTPEQQVDDIANLSTWGADSVTFSFPTEESDDYIGTGREGTLVSFSAAQAQAAREVIALFADLIDLEMIDSGSDVDADIRLYNSTAKGTAGGAPAGAGTAGDMWIYNYDPETIDTYNLDPGSYQWHLLVHEMGHIMGLSHTADGTGETYDEYAVYLQNNQAYTQMSYTRAASAGLEWDTSYAATPMMTDIAALQSIYGANMTTRDKHTVYGFNARADRAVFDFDAQLADYGEIAAIAIWDGGGIDTLDMSGFFEDGFINLRDGTHSSVGGYDFNVSIAHGATIERATGGTGDDVIIGNEVNNRLIGNIGADTLTGGAGNDQLFGDSKQGIGDDFGTEFDHQTVTLSGNQSLSFAMDGTDVTAFTLEMLIGFDPESESLEWFTKLPGGAWLAFDPNNQGVWLWTPDGTWSFTGIHAESVTDGELHRLSITYDGVNNIAQVFFNGVQTLSIEDPRIAELGMGASETVRFDFDGSLADVRIFDGIRTDEDIRINAWAEVDAGTDGLLSNVIMDSTGPRDVAGGAAVTLTDGASYSHRTVMSTSDVLNGGLGNDLLIGGSGADQLNGGDGIDTADYRTSNSAVFVDLTTETGLGGDAAGDQFTSIERVFGSHRNDKLSGSADKDLFKGEGGDDLLIGAGGNDRLIGGGRNDFLIGGAGNDVLSGGGGSDTFVYYSDEGRDRIKDFAVGQDVIAFGSDISFDDLNIRDHSAGGLINVAGTVILVEGVAASHLDAAQFEFWHDDSALTAWDSIA